MARFRPSTVAILRSRKFFEIVLRVVLGLALAALGYWIAGAIVPAKLFAGATLVPPLTALVLGIVGFLVIPAVTALIRRFFTTFVKLLAKELLAQIHFPKLGRTEGSGEGRAKPALILDTSALIDGRIAEIAKTGFLTGTLIIPRFVLRELQHIADSAEELRRSRGRRGFEVIEELKKLPDWVKIETSNLEFPQIKSVDDKLVQLAKKLRARIVTTDYNLNQVAKVSGIKILNVNELANAIKTVLLPGEGLTVKVIQVGKERDQGVGYLPDGTMVVVEGGGSLVGQTIETDVSRVFQTVAGRMIFAKPKKV